MNTLTFEQISTILQAVQEQATGQKALAATNTAEFVSAADTTLRTGPDPILNAISQVLSRTIFSVRPYTRKFSALERSETQYGNHVRKLQVADLGLTDDQRYLYPVGYDTAQDPATGDGQSVDMYKLRKPKVLQTNFYGSSVYADYITVFRDQLNNAFKGPDEFGQFVSMIMGNMSDKLEQSRENFARATLANYAGGIISENKPERVVHLLSEYNAKTGLALTATSVYEPENFAAFMRWVFSRIAAITALMTERSVKYQTVVNNMPVMHHTPYQEQMIFLYAPFRFETESMVLATTFNDNFLKLAYNESVNYWQAIDAPSSINVTPTYIGAGGVPVVGAAVEQDNLFGVIADREALGYAVTQEWMQPTPMNAAGGYTNYHFHCTMKSWNDHTEKGLVLLLD